MGWTERSRSQTAPPLTTSGLASVALPYILGITSVRSSLGGRHCQGGIPAWRQQLVPKMHSKSDEDVPGRSQKDAGLPDDPSEAEGHSHPGRGVGFPDSDANPSVASTESRLPPAANAPQTLIAWCPPDCDPQLMGVIVPQGTVITDSVWWDALADRVTELVLRDPDPEEAAGWACRALGVPGVDHPNQAGQSLVEGNLELRTNLSLWMYRWQDPFPVLACEDSEEVREALAETDLELWIDLAEPQMRSSSLD